MKKTELLNADISAAIAMMGHTDMLAIGDCGLPVPDSTLRIDLALKKGVPGFLETLETVLTELCVEKVTVAEEICEKNAELHNEIVKLFKDIEVTKVPHEELKKMTGDCVAVIRTGEFKPYANIILHSGVTF